jgi:beta-1,2-mannobiose phosphorylase / 1,2-beta-oligomannan phosphorylase
MIPRIDEKLLVEPSDITPSHPDFEVIGVFNPGAIRFGENIYLLVRVAERPGEQRKGLVPSPRVSLKEGLPLMEIDWLPAPEEDSRDVRVHYFEGNRMRLTFISYLTLVRLDQSGFNVLSIDDEPALFPCSEYEEFGIEDPRITFLEGTYYITYVACSRDMGVCTALAETVDFTIFTRRGIIFPMENKDVVILPEKTGDDYMAYHRPGGQYKFEYLSMQCARSRDLIHWGRHSHLLSPRRGLWDSQKLGGGAVPLKTSQGWLELYHGVNNVTEADPIGIYRAGAALFDLNDPGKLIARSTVPILSPEKPDEKTGFVPNVVFPTACIYDIDPDYVLVYCGIADERVKVIRLALKDIMETLV